MEMIRNLAVEQRKRLIARLLGNLERSVYDRLSPAEQQELRQEVLDAVGVYHDFILDVFKVSKEDVIRNEAALELIQQVHDGQRRLERAIGAA